MICRIEKKKKSRMWIIRFKWKIKQMLPVERLQMHVYEWKLHSRMPTNKSKRANKTKRQIAVNRNWRSATQVCIQIKVFRFSFFLLFIGMARDFNSILNGIKPIRLDNYILLIFPIRFEAFFNLTWHSTHWTTTIESVSVYSENEWVFPDIKYVVT